MQLAFRPDLCVCCYNEFSKGVSNIVTSVDIRNVDNSFSNFFLLTLLEIHATVTLQAFSLFSLFFKNYST